MDHKWETIAGFEFCVQCGTRKRPHRKVKPCKTDKIVVGIVEALKGEVAQR